MKEIKETTVISLGGSLIVPEEIDVNFLREFKDLILSHVARGEKFVIICGGGRTCRKYQAVARDVGNASNEDMDWVGIATNNLNAELLRVIFGKDAHKKVIYDLSKEFPLKAGVVVGGALEPGHSSDIDAFLAAKTIGAKRIINLSNIDYAYDKDPNKYPDARRLEKVSWAEYRSLIPKEWKAGLSTPFDPIASEMAQKEKMEVVIMNGRNIPNLANCLSGKKFDGTHIK